MKLLVSVILCFCLPFLLRGQTTEEWLEQKKTQKKYLFQQIAALHEYSGYVQKGFEIAEKGLTTISKIKHGDFSVHNTFFSSLKSINPSIAKYSRVAEVVALQFEIMTQYRKAKQLLNDKLLNADKISYIQLVFTKLIYECAADVKELTLVIAGDKLQMKDDERIKRIDKLYDDMNDKCAFVQGFLTQIRQLAYSREKDSTDISTVRSLYGIKNN
jgi:hypothetical protein